MPMTFHEIKDTIRKLSEENVSLNTFLCVWKLEDTGESIKLSSHDISMTIPIEEVTNIMVDSLGYIAIYTKGFCGFDIIYSLNADGDAVRQRIDIPFAVNDFLKEVNKVLDKSGRELVAQINRGDDLMIGEVIIPRHGLKSILLSSYGVLILMYNDYSLQFRTKKVIKND